MTGWQWATVTLWAFMILDGLWMLIEPERFQRREAAAMDRAVARRVERGRDRYFEELRSVLVYKRPRSLLGIRLTGAAFAIGGTLLLASLYLR